MITVLRPGSNILAYERVPLRKSKRVGAQIRYGHTLTFPTRDAAATYANNHTLSNHARIERGVKRNGKWVVT